MESAVFVARQQPSSGRHIQFWEATQMSSFSGWCGQKCTVICNVEVFIHSNRSRITSSVVKYCKHSCLTSAFLSEIFCLPVSFKIHWNVCLVLEHTPAARLWINKTLVSNYQHCKLINFTSQRSLTVLYDGGKQCLKRLPSCSVLLQP